MAGVPACAQGRQWANPYLVVADLDRAINFYSRAFGFEQRLALPGPGGKTAYAEMAHKDSTIMLGPEDPAKGDAAPTRLGGTHTRIYAYAEDVDALAQRAAQAGAEIVSPPTDRFWGDRCCQLRDPQGHLWTFATHLRDVDPAELRIE